MDKETQRQTLHNVYNKLQEICFLGKDLPAAMGIQQAIGQVHDALALEIQGQKASAKVAAMEACMAEMKEASCTAVSGLERVERPEPERLPEKEEIIEQ